MRLQVSECIWHCAADCRRGQGFQGVEEFLGLRKNGVYECLCVDL